MDRVVDFCLNLLANIVFWVGLGLFVWIFFVLPVRKKFERFFGLQNEQAVVIYLSNLWWSPTDDARPWGEIIAKKELDGAGVIKDVFASATPGFPELVRGLVDNVWTKDKYRATVEVSPQDYQYTPRNMIAIGASTKNSVRRYFLTQNRVLVTIAGEPITSPDDIHAKPLQSTFIVKRAHGDDVYALAPGMKPALIERIQVNHPASSGIRVVFMCAGMTGIESRLAAEYLAQNWRMLDAAASGRRTFARCLVYRDRDNLEYYFDVEE